MAKTIHSVGTFPASPKLLFDIFMTSRLHAAATGAPGTISPKVGGSFSLFGGALKGKTIHLVKNKLVVQTWRSSAFKSTDPDSILVIRFSGDAKRGRMELVHVNVPDHDAKGVTDGWRSYYWNNWAQYLKRQASGKSSAKGRGKRR
jgi:activator of HSP90 ATPase